MSIETIANQRGVFGIAVGREAHQLVLARVHPKAGIVGEGRIEQAERMGEVDLPQHLQAIAAAEGRRGGGPFAYAIHCEHGGARRARMAMDNRRWRRG